MRLLVVVMAFALVCGCVQLKSCDRPYLLVGGACCLDENDDKICDEDKPLPTTTSTSTSTTSSSTTSTTQKIIKLFSPEIVGYYRKDMELRNLTCYLNTTACINNACRTFMRIADCNYTEQDILKGMMYSVASTSTTATSISTTTSITVPIRGVLIYSHQITGFIVMENNTCYFNSIACINDDCRKIVRKVKCGNYTEKDVVRTMMEEL